MGLPWPGLVLHRVGWKSKGRVFRERGHDSDWGFDNVYTKAKAQSTLKEAYVFAINVGAENFKD